MSKTKPILAKSKSKHTVSGNSKPSKKTVFIGRVLSKGVTRNKPGKGSQEVAFSPIVIGAKVEVCDSILSPAGATWYYIRYKGKYGYINVNRIEDVTNNADRFVIHLQEYSDYIKAHYSKFHYKYDAAISTFARAKKKKNPVNITCVAPARWGFHDMDITRKDGSSLIYAKDGSFKNTYTGKAKKKLTRITKGGPVGKTFIQAVNDKSLKKGDIIAFKNATHTATYSGEGYIFFDSGRLVFAYGLSKGGIKIDYTKLKYHNERKISEVLRWRT